MTVFCAIHIDPKTKKNQKAEAVCHHCGKPLCQIIEITPGKIRIELHGSEPVFCGYAIDDPFFYIERNASSKRVQAYHCEQCLINYHRLYRVTVQNIKRHYDRQ